MPLEDYAYDSGPLQLEAEEAVISDLSLNPSPNRFILRGPSTDLLEPPSLYTWTIPAGVQYLTVTLVGGGAGGGHSMSEEPTVEPARGGSAGGHMRRVVDLHDIVLAGKTSLYLVAGRAGYGKQTAFSAGFSDPQIMSGFNSCISDEPLVTYTSGNMREADYKPTGVGALLGLTAVGGTNLCVNASFYIGGSIVSSPYFTSSNYAPTVAGYRRNVLPGIVSPPTWYPEITGVIIGGNGAVPVDSLFFYSRAGLGGGASVIEASAEGFGAGGAGGYLYMFEGNPISLRGGAGAPGLVILEW